MTPLGLTIVVGISMLLIIIIWIIYIIRTLHKLRDQLSQAFDAINSLLSDDLENLSGIASIHCSTPLGRLIQHKGYVIKTIPYTLVGGPNGFKGIVYDNSMKEVITTTDVFPSHSAAAAAAVVHVDFLIDSMKDKIITKPIPPRSEILTEGERPNDD